VIGVDIGHDGDASLAGAERTQSLSSALGNQIAAFHPNCALVPALVKRPPITKLGLMPSAANTRRQSGLVVVVLAVRAGDRDAVGE